jgi:peptide chain release factor 2
MAMLRARVFRIEQRRRNEELARHFDERGEAVGTDLVRNFVLDPYRLVTDHRTGERSERVDEVLAGDLDAFLLASIRSRQGPRRASSSCQRA